MARDLTAGVITESKKTSGAKPLLITGLEFDGGTVRFWNGRGDLVWETVPDPTRTLRQRFKLPSGSSMADAALAGPTLAYSGNDGTSLIWDENATLVSTTNNQPRFDHDPVTGAARGLLIEEQQENICLQSEALGTTWTITRSTVTDDDIVAPDGNTTADKLVEDGTASSTHLAKQTFSFASGVTYVLSAFARQDERSQVRLNFADGAFPSNAFASFDLSAGTVLDEGVGADDSDIVDVGGGRYLCWVVATADLTTSAGAQMFLMSGGVTSYNGDSSSGLHLWGMQLLLAALPASYIPTTTGAVTRSADVNNADISAQLGTASTLFVTARTGYGAGVLVQIDDGTEDERYRIERNASNEIHVIVTVGGVEQADLNLGAVADLTDFKVAVRLAANDFAASLDGAAVVTDTSGTLPTVDTIRFGLDTVGNHWNSTIAEGELFNVGKLNAFLQSLADATPDGDVYTGIGDLGRISEIEEGIEQRAFGISLEISGVPSSNVSLALSEELQNRRAQVWLGFFDDNYVLIADPVLMFKGRMDTMDIKLGKTATIAITAESRLIDWSRPRIRRYTDADQRERFPGDKGFQFVSDTTDKEIVWGAVVAGGQGGGAVVAGQSGGGGGHREREQEKGGATSTREGAGSA